jgi:putative membrane protein
VGTGQGGIARPRHAEEIAMMYTYGEHMSGWGYALGIISTVLFWSLLVLAIAAAVRYLGQDRRERSEPPPPPAPPAAPLTAEQVLAERFARGEIDADEYRQRLDTLRQSGRRAPAGTGS